MLKLVIRKVLTFSAMATLGFALFLGDPEEAYACDPGVYAECFQNCLFACYSYTIQECRPDWCDCASYCDAYCRDLTGC